MKVQSLLGRTLFLCLTTAATAACYGDSGSVDQDVSNQRNRCWLTGGGQTGAQAEHSFGGVINPGCSETASEGGQWNHVFHALGWHAQAFQIRVVECGNVDDHPPGALHPSSPYNYIEWEGTGRILPIAGNTAQGIENVHFYGRAEDRGEPGNLQSISSTNGPSINVDRYFLQVFTEDGRTLQLVDGDADPGTVDPRPITHGNLQIHWLPCPHKL